MPGPSGNRKDEVGHSDSQPGQGNLPLGPGGQDTAEGSQGGRSRSPRSQGPKGANLDELYEENTEIKRETEFRDSTAHPLDPKAGGPKVTPENDLFGKEGE